MAAAGSIPYTSGRPTTLMRTKLDRIVTTLTLAVILAPLGCGDQRSMIRRYQVPHEAQAPAVGTPMATATNQRTLAAIIPAADVAWFFKLTGKSDQIQAVADEFNQLVSSLSFEEERPQWRLPAGWTEEPGEQLRFATLRKGSMEISVSKLPLRTDDMDSYLLANINRWQGQISLPPVTLADFPKITRQIDLADRSATIYDSSPTGGSPEGPPPASATPSSPVTYDRPDGWRQEGRRPMRLATFTVERDEQKIEIVLSQLGPNAGTLEMNVNRWRGQLGLPKAEEAAIKSDLRSIEVEGKASDYLQIAAEDTNEVIFVVIVKRPDLTLFVKLTGDRSLAEAETANFEKFARSIRFSS